MAQFKEGTKVITIVDGELKTGHIDRVYDALKTAIVKFDDRTTAKVAYTDLALAENTQAEPEKEYAEGMKEIDRVDFEKQLAILTAPENLTIDNVVAKILLASTVKLSCRKLIEETFGDKDRIHISRGTLFNKIAYVTNPMLVANYLPVNDEELTILLGLSVATIFFKLLDYYFGDDSENA